MKQLMLAAMQSSSGKTTLTCGLLAALKERGLAVQGFKCGPDYIDPMFHSRVLGVPSRNLDLFLQGEGGVRRTVARCAARAELAVLEGAMGFYDGLAGTTEASAWAVAHTLDTPVVLILRPKGQSITLAAQVQGMMQFRRPSHIAALVLNDCTKGLHDHLKPILEAETGLPVLGYLPPMPQAQIPGRHLGLLTADEVTDFAARYGAIAARLAETVDLDALLDLAAEVPALPEPPQPAPVRCKIAVARDEMACFYYEDTLDALREAGAEPVFFSPERDSALPGGVSGLYIGGGYPELHAGAFSANAGMIGSLRGALAAGMPAVIEGGGVLLMQQLLEDAEGERWPMAGVCPGNGFRTGRLQRFGYLHLSAEEDSLLLRAGEALPAHEFHYWDTTENGSAFLAQKPRSARHWRGGFAGPALYMSFPQLHFGGELPLARRFAQAAEHWKRDHL